MPKLNKETISNLLEKEEEKNVFIQVPKSLSKEMKKIAKQHKRTLKDVYILAIRNLIEACKP